MNDLEKRLLNLSRFGTPNIYCSAENKKWSCTIKFSFTVPGLETKIQSGFGHDTPLDAVKEVEQRIQSMLKQTDAINIQFKRVEQ